MSDKIFISYRRDDSGGHAGRVTDRLEREFGRDLLFIDVDSIPLGTNFVKVLHEEVANCSVLLAMIGPNWLDARDEDGNRRLDNPNDFVRIEIAAALQRDVPVIPILLDGAKIPKANQLPDELKELASRNGLDVRHASFKSDVERLIVGLKSQVELHHGANAVTADALRALYAKVVSHRYAGSPADLRALYAKIVGHRYAGSPAVKELREEIASWRGSWLAKVVLGALLGMGLVAMVGEMLGVRW